MTREEAVKVLKEHRIMFQHDFGWDTSTIKALDMAISALSENKGEWIRLYPDDEFERYECSRCCEEIGYKANFCPNCGADMRKENE